MGCLEKSSTSITVGTDRPCLSGGGIISRRLPSGETLGCVDPFNPSLNCLASLPSKSHVSQVRSSPCPTLKRIRCCALSTTGESPVQNVETLPSKSIRITDQIGLLPAPGGARIDVTTADPSGIHDGGLRCPVGPASTGFHECVSRNTTRDSPTIVAATGFNAESTRSAPRSPHPTPATESSADTATTPPRRPRSSLRTPTACRAGRAAARRCRSSAG
jgi:hypothetical protein